MISRIKIDDVAFRIIRILLFAAICGSITTAAAQDDVSGKAFKESALLKKREQSAAKDIDKYAIQLDKTGRALTRLGRADGKDLRKHYESFSKELKKLGEAQERAISSLDRMKATGVEYFSSWEKANASISDPELREIAAQRRSLVMLSHIELGRAVGDIGLQLQPFMGGAHDLRAFLGADLTPENVRRAGDRIHACQADVEALKSRIGEVQTTFKRLLNEMPE